MDEITITLPASKFEVVIRNYTTVGDDEKSDQYLYAGVTSTVTAAKKDPDIDFPLANLMAAEKSYIPRLVKSIDGDTNNIKLRIEELRTEDGKAIAEAVAKVVEEHSPKAKQALNDKKSN